jgi:hypothetical protein
MNNWHYIAWHTEYEYYREYARQLHASVVKNGVRRIEIVERNSVGNWLQDATFKPYFIREMIDKTTDDLVYLDSDCLVYSYPVLFDTIEEDVAAHHKDRKELLGSTLFFKNNDRSRLLLDKWIERMEELLPHRMADQIALQQLVPFESFFELPASYCQIFDHMAHNGEPVIEQLQASRHSPN